MHWIPWVSFDSWDAAANRWFCWRRLTKYRLDGSHRRSWVILGKPRFLAGLREVLPPREEHQ